MTERLITDHGQVESDHLTLFVHKTTKCQLWTRKQNDQFDHLESALKELIDQQINTNFREKRSWAEGKVAHLQPHRVLELHVESGVLVHPEQCLRESGEGSQVKVLVRVPRHRMVLVPPSRGATFRASLVVVDLSPNSMISSGFSISFSLYLQQSQLCQRQLPQCDLVHVLALLSLKSLRLLAHIGLRVRLGNRASWCCSPIRVQQLGGTFGDRDEHMEVVEDDHGLVPAQLHIELHKVGTALCRVVQREDCVLARGCESAKGGERVNSARCCIRPSHSFPIVFGVCVTYIFHSILQITL